MYQNDVELAAAGYPRRLNEGFNLDAQRLGLEDYGGAAEAAQHADNQGQVKEIQGEECAQHYQQGNGRQGDNQVRQTHKESVHQAAVIGGNRPHCGGDDYGYQGCGYAQDELGPGAGK